MPRGPERPLWEQLPAGERLQKVLATRGYGSRRVCEDLIAAGGFPGGLHAAGVPERDLPDLATEAADQWTGTFNPRKFDMAGALEIYAAAF